MSPLSRPRAAMVLTFALIAPVLAACNADPEGPPQQLPTATVPTDSASAPSGWVTRQGPGFQVSVPPEWVNRPDTMRANKSAILEVGPAYTGGSKLPVTFFAFVEREQVGPLGPREAVLRAQLESSIPNGTIGKSTHIKIAGSTDAVYFDVTYPFEGGESATGDQLSPTEMRQRELLIETAGLPKYGFRYNAPVGSFDEQQWQQVARSIVTRAGGPAPSTPTATS